MLRNKQRLYWTLQLGGWTLYGVVQIAASVIASTSSSISNQRVLFLVYEAFFCLVISHGYRNFINQWRWLGLRITRSSMLDVLGTGYITMARARGLSERRVLWGHALRPALLPVASYLGPAAAALLTGSVVVEQIFGIPGIGRYFVQGAVNRDYTLVMGVVVFYGTLVIGFNMLVDISYRLIDPRLRRS